MSDYATLQSDLVDLVEDRSTMFDNVKGTYINRAIKDIQRRRLWHAMETTVQFSTVADQDSYTLASIGAPATRYHLHDLMELTDGTNKIEIHKENSWATFRDRRLVAADSASTASTDRPACFILRGASIYWFPTPDAAYVVDWWFHQFLADLSGGTDTNWFTDNVPDVILNRAAILSGAFLRDPGAIKEFRRLYEETFKEAWSADNYERYHRTNVNVHQMHDYGIG